MADLTYQEFISQYSILTTCGITHDNIKYGTAKYDGSGYYQYFNVGNLITVNFTSLKVVYGSYICFYINNSTIVTNLTTSPYMFSKIHLD